VNPYVFIVGCARSGTKLLRKITDAHPRMAIPRETNWIPKPFERRQGVTPNGLVTPELVSWLLSCEKFTRMRIGQDELEVLVAGEEPVSYSTFVTGVFDLYGKGQGKRLVGDKTPSYLRHIPTLHALWPQAKFVHLIRDGRDVCLSILNWKRGERVAGRFATWSEDPVSITALWWKWNVMLGREDGAPLGPDLYREVHYEALVSEPANECKTLCDFLNLPYDEGMLRFHERLPDPRFYDGKQMKWRPIVTGLRDWKAEMPAEDLERFEAVAGDLLQELGYERAFPFPSSRALEHAARTRETFSRDVQERGARLPERWWQ
jgi:hypothetical protein